MTGAVVVVSWASAHLLERGLLPLTLAAPELQVVVVDSWSSVAEREAVRALSRSHGWHLVEPAYNTGFGGGADLGIAAAVAGGCDAVLLLNPDASLSAEAARVLLDQVRSDTSLLLSPVVLRPDGSPWFTGGVLDLLAGRTGTRGRLAHEPGTGRTARWLSGACLAVSTEGWRQRGGFDPRYFLYWEDVELSLRWERAGGRLEVREGVVAVHDVGGTQGDTPGKSPLYVRWNCRNRLLLAGQLGARTYLRWAATAPSYAWEVVRRGGRRQLLRRPQLVVAAVRGTAAGLGAGIAAMRTTSRAGAGDGR